MNRRMLVLLTAILASFLNAPLTALGIPFCVEIGCVACPDHGPSCPGSVRTGTCIDGETQAQCRWLCGWWSSWQWCHCEDSGGGGGCFLAGTPILLPEGNTNAIDQIGVGDHVRSFDEATNRMTVSEVVHVHNPHVVDHYYVINGVVRVSGSQPVLSNGSWVQVDHLKVGDVLMGSQADPVPVVTITRIETPVTVYNLEIGELSTYIASGIVVHNKCFYELAPCEGCHN